MYAVLVTIDVEPGHEQEGVDHIQREVIPAIRQIPGIQGAYWLQMVKD